MMNDLPLEPQAFTDHVARLVALHPDVKSVRVIGPLELDIDGQIVDLANLQRVAALNSLETGDLIEQFVSYLITKRRLEQMPMPFEVAAGHILPRIQPIEHFRDRRVDLVAHQPFVNDTLIVYMIELNGVAMPITIEQLIRWGVPPDDLDPLARRNLADHQPELELQLFTDDDSEAALLSTGDGYDASRLLLEHMHAQLAPRLGRDFLVAIPARDVLIAFSAEPPPFVGRVRCRVESDFRTLPYPITSSLFLMTQDGVAPWNEAA